MSKSISAEEFDRIFDEGKEDILQYCDLDHIRRPGHEQRKVNLTLPSWMINDLDHEAEMLGVTRQAIIKLWIAEKIKTNPLP